MIEVIERNSIHPGLHLLILGSIHGNEKCGTKALKKFISELDSGHFKLVQGSLTLVPIANPRAFEANKRFVEENLNRVIFPSENPSVYERQLANIICPLIERSDYLLDLHSMEAKGKAFTMINQFNRPSLDFCLALSSDVLVEGWPEVFADHPEVLSCCTQSYADRFNIPSVLIECGSHDDPEAADAAYDAILSALCYLKILDASELAEKGIRIRDQKSKRLRLREIIFRQSLEDTFARDWKNFDAVKKGELIATRKSSGPLVAPFDCVLVFPNSKTPVGVEWCFLASASES